MLVGEEITLLTENVKLVYTRMSIMMVLTTMLYSIIRNDITRMIYL